MILLTGKGILENQGKVEHKTFFFYDLGSGVIPERVRVAVAVPVPGKRCLVICCVVLYCDLYPLVSGLRRPRGM